MNLVNDRNGLLLPKRVGSSMIACLSSEHILLNGLFWVIICCKIVICFDQINGVIMIGLGGPPSVTLPTCYIPRLSPPMSLFFHPSPKILRDSLENPSSIITSVQKNF